MASINGDWFHSKSSSNLEELLTVRTLVLESQKPEYIGFGWSGDRSENKKVTNAKKEHFFDCEREQIKLIAT